MKGFNPLRWLLAGLVFGVIIYVLEAIANTAVLGKDWMAWAAITAKAYPAPNETMSLIHWGFQALVGGLVGAFIYAASHAWFDDKVKAGLSAGFIIWAVGWLGMTFDKMAMGNEPMKLLHVNLLFAIAACLLGGVATAYIYKDKVS